MENKKNLVRDLKQKKMTLTQDLNLYDTMVFKQQIYSRTESEIEQMEEFKNDLKVQVDHVDHKISSCLDCDKVLFCKKKC